MASSHLTRTLDATSGGGYSNKWTWSGWVKRSNLGELGIMGNQRTDNNINSRFKLYFRSTDRLGWECKDSGGNDDSSFETNMLFKDVNSWYHIVFIYDSDNSTESDRMKCYVNGKDVRTELGGFSSINEVGSGFGTLWSSSVVNYLGTSGNNSGNTDLQFDGYMSHCHLTYGHRYEASTFGESDSNGVWKIKTDPSVTYGSQGYFLLKDNGSVTDQSGEGNNYTATGTITNDKDNPSDVFCTFNSILPDATGDGRLTNGSTTISCVDTTWISRFGTIGFTSGKYYWELKVEALNASNGYAGAGIQCLDNAFGSGVGTSGNTNTQFTSNSASAGFEIDYRGGSKTGAIAIPTSVTTCSPAAAIYGANAIFNYNFGNGRFKTTAVSSAGTNASGHGVFEYDVPTGYTALCTKGLNS